MVIIQIKDVPDDLHRALKMACASEGVTIRAKVLELIKEYVERQEEKRAKK